MAIELEKWVIGTEDAGLSTRSTRRRRSDPHVDSQSIKDLSYDLHLPCRAGSGNQLCDIRESGWNVCRCLVHRYFPANLRWRLRPVQVYFVWPPTPVSSPVWVGAVPWERRRPRRHGDTETALAEVPEKRAKMPADEIGSVAALSFGFSFR